VNPRIDQDAGRRRRSIRRGVALTVLLVGMSAFAAYFHRPLFRGNLGVVDEGVLYRSAQPKGELLAMIREHKLGSIVNLRGGKDSDSWYTAEVEATRKAGVEFYDLPMSAVRRPSRRELLVLLDMLDRCKYPLLIHCKSGSDRTGLATGLYLMYRKGEPPERASGAFSLAYGHVPLLGPERLHEPFNEYAVWLASQHFDHTPERLVDWVRHEYRADDPLVAIDPVHSGPRPPHQATRDVEPSAAR
jgi:protein tyrosine phosphatase (PTP) superfamily phosphohydrolase (DUF442 family)